MVNSGKIEEIHEAAWSLSGLFEWWEFLVTPDNFGIWKRHLAWGNIDGDRLLSIVTQRFGSSMVFLSMLLSVQLMLLFNSADVPTSVRRHLCDANYRTVEFYVGLLLVLGSIMTLFALLTTFTAWGMVCSLSKRNALPVLRSSIGQLTTTMPSRLVAQSFLICLAWMVLYLYVLLPKYLAGCFVVFSVFMYLRMVHVYSAFGRLLMHSGAMGDDPIFDTNEEKRLKADEFNLRLSVMAVQQANQTLDGHAPDEESTDAGSTVTGVGSRRADDGDEEAADDGARAHRRAGSTVSMGDFSVAEQAVLDEWAMDQARRHHRRIPSGISRPSGPHRRIQSVPAVLQRPGSLTRFLSGGKGKAGGADGTTNVTFGASTTLGNVGIDVEKHPLLPGIVSHGDEAGKADWRLGGDEEVAAAGDADKSSFLANVHEQPSWVLASQDSSVLYAVSEGNEVTTTGLGEGSAGDSSQKTTGNQSRKEETPLPLSNFASGDPHCNLGSDESRPSLTSVPEGAAMDETDHDDSVVLPLGQQTRTLNVKSRENSDTPVSTKGDANRPHDVGVISRGRTHRLPPFRVPGSVSLEANLRVSDLTDQGNGNSMLLSDSLVSSTTRELCDDENKDNPDDSGQAGGERQILLSSKLPAYH